MRIIACIALFCIVSFTAFSQKKGDKFANTMTERMVSELKLDSTQAKKVRVANENYVNGLAELYKNKGDRKEKMQQSKQVKEDHEAALQSILTKEQYKTYEAMRKEQQEKLSQAAAEKISENLTATMQDTLKLSNDVATKAYDINVRSLKTVLMSMMDDEQRGMEKLRSLKEATEKRNEEMKKIFTKEQYQQYMKMNEENKEKMKEKWKQRRNG